MIARPELTEEEKRIIKQESFSYFFKGALEDEKHGAYQILLAALYYLSDIMRKNVTVRQAFIMFNSLMYARVFYFEAGLYPILPEEKKMLETLRVKIESTTKSQNKNIFEICEIVNVFIINLLISEEWIVYP